MCVCVYRCIFKKCSVAHVARCDSPKKHGEFGLTCGITHVTHCNSRLKYKIKREHPFSNFSQ